MNFLEEILQSTLERIQSSRRARPLADLKRMIRDREKPRPFGPLLERGSRPALVAELKWASPSRGLLRPTYHPVDLARVYEEEGAAAISILTEERFFKGSLDHLGAVRRAVGRPLLRKDFLIEEYQVYESRAFEADAVLLIAGILDDSRLAGFRALAGDLGMDHLIEVHDESELERAIGIGAGTIGINNRDLKTFKTDLGTTLRLITRIPDDRIVVSESGIAAPPDIDRLMEAGVDAVLIGEIFMKSPDVRARVREMFSKSDGG